MSVAGKLAAIFLKCLIASSQHKINPCNYGIVFDVPVFGSARIKGFLNHTIQRRKTALVTFNR